MNSERPKATLRLMQLCSPMLPVGAYAYSQGLEFAVSSGWVKDDNTASIWIKGLLGNSLTSLDIPILSRLHEAWLINDKKKFSIGMIIYLEVVTQESSKQKNNN